MPSYLYNVIFVIALKCLGTFKEPLTPTVGTESQGGHGLGIIERTELQ